MSFPLTTNNGTEIQISLFGPQGPAGPVGPAGAAGDVGDLTAIGLTAGNFLRVASSGGLEEVGLVVTRTVADHIEAIPESVNISGSLSINGNPVVFPELFLSTLPALKYSEYPVYFSIETISGPPIQPRYILGVLDSEGGWLLIDAQLGAVWSAPVSGANVFNATNWQPVTGSGTPIFDTLPLETAQHTSLPTPQFIGQKCVVGAAIALEFTSLDGVVWTLTGPAGVIEDPNSLGGFLQLTVDGDGAMDPQTYTPAD
jgi:hypothetical protein